MRRGDARSGFRVALIKDALCSSSDRGHDNLIDIYNRRYSQQICTLETADLLGIW